MRWKYDIQEIDEDIAVPPVSEDGLEPGIGKDVDIAPCDLGWDLVTVHNCNFQKFKKSLPLKYGGGTPVSIPVVAEFLFLYEVFLFPGYFFFF